ncbi:major prion protein homolog [Mastacembelus armatus]|uniref:major prion protein homolog n=1 Tax=Mastacembelus armatus TaxID=205130 RepID=UPI000E45720E|nr:major prion protein homolog [Mastacembelus armatus]
MKLTVTAVLCLSFLLIHTHFSLARKNIKIGEKLNFFKKDPKIKSHVDSKSKGKQLNQGGYPQQPHRPGGYPNQGGYYQQPGYTAGGYLPQGYPNRGGYGGYGSYGGYPGGYVNHNPNNKILSPHYGGSFGYGGYGVYGGSPFSHSVSAMGTGPTDVSRGFGHSAVLAAAGGAMAGMALGYGLGRFPRPHFHFHNPQEEYYYNHYMYRRYGMKSSDTNDYSRDYRYTQPPETYDRYMDSCMKRTDLLPAETRKSNNKETASTIVTSAPITGTETNNTVTENSLASAPSHPDPLNQPGANALPPASQALNSAEDDDTVSIVEIGYPALIEQLKVRKCLEYYIVYSEKYLKKQTGGADGLEMGLRGLLAVITSTILMLLNSNMLLLLH